MQRFCGSLATERLNPVSNERPRMRLNGHPNDTSSIWTLERIFVGRLIVSGTHDLVHLQIDPPYSR
jgi:hypothetical protein